MSAAAPPPLNDDDLICLLASIKDMALTPYPYTAEGAALDPDLLITLSEIAGKASGALSRYQRRSRHRPIGE